MPARTGRGARPTGTPSPSRFNSRLVFHPEPMKRHSYRPTTNVRIRVSQLELQVYRGWSAVAGPASRGDHNASYASVIFLRKGPVGQNSVANRYFYLLQRIRSR